MLRSLDLNTAAERNLVQSFAIQTVARLSPVDSKLPQVIVTCEMVKRGIGVVRPRFSYFHLACNTRLISHYAVK